jgi:hypothetical protein
MADLVQTAANVQLMQASAGTKEYVAGEAVTQGQPVYKATDNKAYLTDANVAAKHAAVGFALTPAATNESFLVQQTGKIDLGATLTQGTIYVVSATAGKVAPEADLTTGDNVCILGIAESADTLKIAIINHNIAKP